MQAFRGSYTNPQIGQEPMEHQWDLGSSDAWLEMWRRDNGHGLWSLGLTVNRETNSTHKGTLNGRDTIGVMLDV